MQGKELVQDDPNDLFSPMLSDAEKNTNLLH